MKQASEALSGLLQSMENAARRSGRPVPRLLAVSKTQPAEAVARLASAGQLAFGENYVQEALAKIQALPGLHLEWHLIGHLQSNKCRDVALHFDWVQSLDRAKLVPELAKHRPEDAPALNILIQVNPDGEAGKSGCDPREIESLAAAVAASPRLRLRGLMAIPEPDPDMAVRSQTFARLAQYLSSLRNGYPGVDTLSMGMSEDYELAIAEGASMIRVGTALFGPRA
jgi:pyridoxal phosphate enzyme (YggS family)